MEIFAVRNLGTYLWNFLLQKLKNRYATRYIMTIYHEQAVQFLINQFTRVSDQLKMRKCRTMNHLEKGYYRQLQNFLFWLWTSQGSIHQSWLVLEPSDHRTAAGSRKNWTSSTAPSWNNENFQIKKKLKNTWPIRSERCGSLKLLQPKWYLSFFAVISQSISIKPLLRLFCREPWTTNSGFN